MRCNIPVLILSAVALSLAACAHGDSRSASADAKTAASSKSSASSPHRLLPPGADIGMWVWHREEVVDAAARARLLEFCRKYGITRLLVQVRFVENDGRFELAPADAWQALLREASRAGVAIEALDGADTMGFAANRANTLARLQGVLDFQRKQPAGARFAGVHYDIEPYTSARWKSGDVPAVMHEFLDTLSALRETVRDQAPDLTISHDIPAFYDGQEKHLIEFNGVRKNLHEHVQDLSDYVGIMSYRTRATGANSAASISAAEIAYAAKIKRPVYLSLETVPLKDTPQITFHGRSREEYVGTIRELHAHLDDNPAFGGLLLHQYRAIRPILENEAPAAR